MTDWRPGPPDPKESMVWEVRFPAGMAAIGLSEAPPALAMRVGAGLWELVLDPGGRNEAIPMADDNPRWSNLEVRPCTSEEEA